MPSNKDYVLALYHQQGVEELFDEYAETFDNHLQTGLQYNVPRLLFYQWEKDREDLVIAKCLDLGCGTGLAGVLFRDSCKYLEGVDLSNGMCQQAKRKNIYDKVIHASLLSHMKKHKSNSFDLIISADVFMYVLDLKAVMKEIGRILKPGGLAVFSTESLEEESRETVIRRESDRFAHKRTYVIDVATAGLLSLKNVDRAVLRMEEGKPVHGDLFVFVSNE